MSGQAFDIAAEQQVLGTVLQFPDALDGISLSPEDFANEKHAIIWRMLVAMTEAGTPIDVVSVAESMERTGSLGDDGLSYLAHLHSLVYSSANVGRHASTVREHAIRRALRTVLASIGETLDAGDIADTLADAQGRIMAIGEKAETRQPVSVAGICKSRLNVLAERYEGNDDGLDTGLTDLDDKLGKIRPGDLTVIAGRPAMGKSACAMQLVEHMARKIGKPALFFSLEMTAGQLVDRLMSSSGKVNLKKFRTAKFDDNDWQSLASSVGKLNEMPVFIDDHSQSLGQILAVARSFKRRHGGLSAIAIDYIGLVSTQADNREQEIAKITRALKQCAKQLGCPVLALSQLNRKLEDRPNKRPQMSDLRESGAIEQDADQILMLYRDEVYNSETQDKGVCEILIRKNRHGETGMVPTVFRADVVRFENFAGTYIPPEDYVPMRRSRERI